MKSSAADQFANNATWINSMTAIQKTAEATGNLSGNEIADKMTRATLQNVPVTTSLTG